MPLIQIQQFAPDSDFTIPGMVVDCEHLIPSVRGYKAAPTAVSAGFDALASTCVGAAAVRVLDGTPRVLAGVATKLYELDGTTWTDVSRVAAYSATVDSRWSFAQFGNVTLAVNKADTLQYSATALTDFADIATAPKAATVETVNQFVMVANTNDGGFGDSPDRWWCCAIGDYTDWTPDTSTQCVSGRLTSSPGGINLLKRLGDGIVAYKDRSMFIGSYVGTPEIWSFQEIPGSIGCMAPGGVVDIGSAHVFVGWDGNFWLFDGSRPTAIGTPIKDWFSDNLNADYAYRIQSVHDRVNSLVYFFYPSWAGGGAIDSCLVYNYRINKWGVDDRTIEAAVDFVASGVTYAGAYAVATTFAAADTAIVFSSPMLIAGQPAPAFVGTDHSISTLTGAGGSWTMTTNDFGDDVAVSTVTRVRPRFLTAPTSCTMTNYYRMVQGDALTTDATSTYTDGKFDFIRAARWHRLAFSGTGGGEIVGLDVKMSGASLE